jgi:hypothetical protein
MREGRPEYSVLLRRRLLDAPGSARPFQSCSRFLERLGLGEREKQIHELPARDFVEYRDEDGPGHRLDELGVTLDVVRSLADEAWPFVRGGYARLIEPSTHTEEAPHTSAPAAPGLGRGLPERRAVYRSTAVYGNRVVTIFGSGQGELALTSDDGGHTFRPGGSNLHSELSERCPIDQEGRSFTTMTSGAERVVLSHGPAAVPHVAFLSSARQRLLAVACDAQGLVALVLAGEGRTGQVAARSCAYRGRCVDMRLPELAGEPLAGAVDIARLAGDTIVAVATGGITRVASSRNGGQDWTPWIVAFDRRSLSKDGGERTPFHLLAVADSVLLYGGAARADQSYYLLASADHGATFRAPD